MKQTIYSIAIIFSLLFSGVTANASSSKSSLDINNRRTSIAGDSVDVIAIQKRVIEIQGMDLSTLSHSQRRALRVELKSMYKQLYNYEGGGHSTYIVISGGLIVLILILILILR